MTVEIRDAMDKKRVIESERGILKHLVVSRVQPSTISQHPEFLYPTVYDYPYMDFYMPSVCLYRLGTADPLAFSNFIHCVKTSLSQVLSLYYPLAGKWIATKDVWIRKLVCNDEGAVFVEAAIDEEMDKIIDRNDLNVPDELTGLHAVPGFEAATGSQNSETNEYPSLIVQVVRFRCGGVALTLNFSHMITDGYAFNRFLKAWSEIASTGQTTLKPLTERSVSVSLLEKLDILGIPPDTKNLDDNLSSYFRLFSPEQMPYTEVGAKLFSIKKDAVEKLRQKARKEDVTHLLEQPERLTTFECVSAQVWRSFARIPTILPSMTGDDKVRFLTAVEGRKKWHNPSLSEDYLGNMIMLGCPPDFSASEIKEKPFAFAASHIHKAVTAVNHSTSGEMVDGMLKGIREIKETEGKHDTGNSDKQARTLQLYTTSWSRFDSFYNLDFGYGCPEHFFPCFAWRISASMLCLLPPAPKSGNALDMYVRVPVEYMRILLEDPEFIDLVS